MIDGYDEFLKLRRYFFEELKNVDMSYCKQYEGTFDLLLSYANYFEEDSGDNPIDNPIFATIELYCYVLGPDRHYKWSGKTIHDAVDLCKKDITRWIEEYKNGT